MRTLAVLTRHFIGATLAPEVLTQLGSDYLRRLLFGFLAVLLVLGIFITRIFFAKYTNLLGVVGRETYQRAVQADTLMMIAVPMLLVGLASVIAGPLLFPDETDYRVLTPLPITRAQLFITKLAAVAVIVALAIFAANLITTFWFPVAVSGRKAEHGLASHIGAHAVASLLGSVFMFFAVMAVQGLALVAAPRGWQRRLSVVVQGTLLVGLLTSFPFIARISGMTVTGNTISHSPLIYFPASWFMGVERWLLDGSTGNGYFIAARVAVSAMSLVFMVVAVTYLLLYRSAERLAGFTGAERRGSLSLNAFGRLPLMAQVPAQSVAVMDFVRAGLSRSRLHQFVFTIALGGGLAVSIGQVLTLMEGAGAKVEHSRAVLDAAVAAPLLIALTYMLGLRAAMRWPLERAAAWVFRFTEDPQTRRATLNGSFWLLSGGGAISAMLTGAIIQPRVLGTAAISAALLTLVTVLTLAETLMINWRRVPFACSYLPGKHVLAYHMGVLFAHYFVVVVIGGNLIRWATVSPMRAIVVGLFLIVGWVAARRERLATWGIAELEFDDDDPSEVSVLRIA